ncbi:MAG: glutathione S-transferase [Glaciecola sp.]|jgi:glutathione S-transferase
MYTLHIANKNYSSWSLRPWILLTELGIAFEEKLTPFAGSANAEEFKKFSPSAKVPCLYDAASGLGLTGNLRVSSVIQRQGLA